jgi:uncharacterized protein (DUF1330 family)
MPAFVIVDITIHDPEQYKQYIQMTPPTIKAYGGRFVVRGGATTILEGNWNPERLVVLEFDSVDRAKAWWDSKEYAPAKALRQSIATTQMLVIEGA